MKSNYFKALAVALSALGMVSAAVIDQRDAKIKIKDRLMDFDTIRTVDTPQYQPFHFRWKDIVFYNFARVDDWKEHWPDNMLMSGDNTEVAAIGGVTDSKGQVLECGTAMMTIKGNSKTFAFDLLGFDFFCIHENNPVDCDIGIRLFNSTSQLMAASAGVAPILQSSFKACQTPPCAMAHSDIGPLMGNGLVAAQFGLPLLASVRNDTSLLPPQAPTAFIDNIRFRTYEGNEKTAKYPFGSPLEEMVPCFG